VIFDTFDNAGLYTKVHPGFAAAFDFLRRTDFSKLASGKNEIDGDRLYVMVNRDPGEGREKRKLEYHRRYIDIQCVLEGVDEIGWRQLGTCSQVDKEFDADRDYGLYRDVPETYFQVGAGRFAIFYPTDAHAPLCGSGPLLKPVFKVAIDWK
jgi:YhcH/YjgK/YiaL family protein